LLVEALREQYAAVTPGEAVNRNIDLLLHKDTFTVTTAHQPNIFTGPLYVIYKIMHVIRLAEDCSAAMPGYHFVPVFWMGSEDADLDELGHFHLGGEKLVWQTEQAGAVGRMKVDRNLLSLIDRVEGQLTVLPFGDEILSIVRDCFQDGMLLQIATFHFLSRLFGRFGLIVIIPDTAALKNEATRIFKDELLNERASGIVEKTVAMLEHAGYKTQANPRDINLFYLDGNIRNRIVRKDGEFRVQDTNLRFSEDEILRELDEHPDRFSPNVILRGLYQETILPNLVYVGGGGEIAYWLQLKELFAFYEVPFPLLQLRNSFLLVRKKWTERMQQLGLRTGDIFLSEDALINEIVEKGSPHELRLNGNFVEAEKLYEALKEQAGAVDETLKRHVDALKTHALHRLNELEKKIIKAEKRKYVDQRRQLVAIRSQLFPKNGLQERIENILYFYALWGPALLGQLHRHIDPFSKEFFVLSEQ
jgi:bacillithiol biosynthesis cysteine-adding enzyme BshC